MFDTMYYGVYFFFASMMVLAAIFVFFLVPETKGIPLEKMDRLFEPGLAARHAHRVVMAEVRVEDEEFRRRSVGGGGGGGDADRKEREFVDEKQVERV